MNNNIACIASGTFDDVDPGDDSEDDGSYNANIPSAQDRGASLDNTDTMSNLEDNMNGFTFLDLNEILQ